MSAEKLHKMYESLEKHDQHMRKLHVEREKLWGEISELEREFKEKVGANVRTKIFPCNRYGVAVLVQYISPTEKSVKIVKLESQP